jgi:molecular chaperone GrpE (heat shock protein)
MSKIQLGKSAGWIGIAGGAIPLIVQVAEAIWSERRKKKQRADRAISEDVLKALPMIREKDEELAQLRSQLAAREEEVLRVRKELAEVYRKLEEERRKKWWQRIGGK